MIRKLIILFLTVIGLNQSNAQEVKYSQFMLSSLYMNPAYASAYTDMAVNMNYKQINAQNIDFQASQVSLVFPLKIDNISENVAGIGLMAYNQSSESGIYTDNGLSLTYAQNFNLGLLGSDLIAVGIQGQYSRSATTLSDRQWGSQFSRYIEGGFNGASPAPITEFDNSFNQITFNAGVMYYYNRKRNYLLHNYSAFSGIAVSNINRPNQAFSLKGKEKESINLSYHGGVEVRTGNLYILPNMLVNYTRQRFDVVAGMHFALSFTSTARFTSANKGIQLLFGSWYTLRESYTLLGGVQVNSLAIRGSYDLDATIFVEKDAIPVTPAFEISLTYMLGGDGTMRKMNNALF